MRGRGKNWNRKGEAMADHEFRPYLNKLRPGQRFYRVTDDQRYKPCEMLGVINGRRYFLGQDNLGYVVGRFESQCQVTLAKRR